MEELEKCMYICVYIRIQKLHESVCPYIQFIPVSWFYLRQQLTAPSLGLVLCLLVSSLLCVVVLQPALVMALVGSGSTGGVSGTASSYLPASLARHHWREITRAPSGRDRSQWLVSKWPDDITRHPPVCQLHCDFGVRRTVPITWRGELFEWYRQWGSPLICIRDILICKLFISWLVQNILDYKQLFWTRCVVRWRWIMCVV